MYRVFGFKVWGLDAEVGIHLWADAFRSCLCLREGILWGVEGSPWSDRVKFWLLIRRDGVVVCVALERQVYGLGFCL